MILGIECFSEEVELLTFLLLKKTNAIAVNVAFEEFVQTESVNHVLVSKTWKEIACTKLRMLVAPNVNDKLFRN